MKISRAIWIAIAILLLWLLLSWLLGGWIGLHAPGLYYLRGGLSILGIIGFIGYLILRPKSDPNAQPGVSSGEMDDNFNEASKRLQSSGVKRLATLPTVFFLGDSDSAKTSVIAKSDIAQLLAGQAQKEVAIVPTRAVNFWIAKNSVFVDPAGALLGDAENRKRLFHRFSSLALRSVMGSRAMPARSAVITVSCETLLQPGGADAMASKARQFQTILAELAQEIGSTFPVYVLFTKIDKIAYFRDFVENLSEQEAAEVFGITLPLETESGVYSEQQTKRVNDAFQQLYYWLADRRPRYLIREHKPAALPNIYEFPREFNKVRTLLTRFLVDLGRPSQLGISPFLRGFYFTGIRAVTVNDVAPAPLQVAPTDDGGTDSGATRMFTFPPRGGNVPLVPDAPAGGARKIAQWVYLSQFLPGVVLADNTAISVGGSNVKLNVARRAVLAAATVAAVLMGAWWAISYSNNRALIHGALDAAKGVPSVASLDALQRLTHVKDTLATINEFKENGRPLSYGGFLYSGDDAMKSVSETYYGMFRRLLLTPTQENLMQVCKQPSDSQKQDYLYDDLKSYLVTTQYHDKSVPEFLTPALLLHWKAGHTVSAEEERLARLNFDFYSRELPNKNEYWPPSTPDGDAVRNCRDYLNRLGQTDPVYRRMLADAGNHEAPLIFNDEFAGTEPYVSNHYPVDPGYKKTGFDRFQGLLKNIKEYAKGETWVLEPPSTDTLDQTKLSVAMRQMYKDNFIKAWIAYLKATIVHKPVSVSDAVAKLDKLASDRSAIVEVLCLASENTDVPDKEISDVFRSVHVATPPGCLHAPVSGAGRDYVQKLLALSESLKNLDNKKADTYDGAQHAAKDVYATVGTIALNFTPPTDEVVTKILKDPVWSPDHAPATAANEAAAGTCNAIRDTLRKYPFNPASREDASMAEVDGFLKKPDGSFWKLVNNPAVMEVVSQYGETFSAKASSGTRVNGSFLNYLNRAAALSHLLYGPTGQAAGFKFAINPVPVPNVVEHVVLDINGSIQSTDSRGTPTKEFEWPGNGEGENLQVKFAGGSEFRIVNHPGLWGVWRFMDSGIEVKPNEFEWALKQGPDKVKTNRGDEVAIRFTIDPSKAAVLRPRYFAITCVPKVD